MSVGELAWDIETCVDETVEGFVKDVKFGFGRVKDLPQDHIYYRLLRMSEGDFYFKQKNHSRLHSRFISTLQNYEPTECEYTNLFINFLKEIFLKTEILNQHIWPNISYEKIMAMIIDQITWQRRQMNLEAIRSNDKSPDCHVLDQEKGETQEAFVARIMKAIRDYCDKEWNKV